MRTKAPHPFTLNGMKLRNLPARSSGRPLFILLTSLLSLLTAKAGAEEFKSRVEVHTRLGTDRSIGMVELWHPLAQDYQSVLYTDLRLMGDNSDNREFNFGIGHRHLVNDDKIALGLHGWVDRRTTELGSTFYQLAGGYEFLTADSELRVNAYLPFNQKETYSLPGGIGSSTPYLGGTGIYYDGTGQIVERPMHGLDVEAGYHFNLPVLPETNFRAAAGAFVFSADNVETIRGTRLKFGADVTSDIEVGLRMENDNVRGSQAFLEGTLRFPFGSKAARNTLSARSRLDESPERDIDIVSGKTVDTGMRKPVLNAATGQAQRVFYVDNTAVAGGDGSYEHPFNTIAQANAAITKTGDMVYVYHGDGTAAQYDTGITLAQREQALIGEGTAFVFDGTRFRAGNSTGAFNGYTLIAAGAAPTLSDDGTTGAAVVVTADDVTLSGFKADNSTGDGINIGNASNTQISNVSTSGNAGYGLYVYADDNKTRSFTLDGFTSNNNGIHGIDIEAFNDSVWDGVTLSNLSLEGNLRGVFLQTADQSIIRNVTISDSSVINQLAEGFGFNAVGSRGFENVTLDNLYADNVYNGILIQGGASSTINNVTINDFTTTGNTAGGLRLRTSASASFSDIAINNMSSSSNDASGSGIQIINGATTSAMANITVDGGTFGSNGQSGISVSNAGHMQDLTLKNLTASGNSIAGIAYTGGNGSTMDNLQIDNTVTSGNTSSGLSLVVNPGGKLDGANITNATSGGNLHGLIVSNAGQITDIDVQGLQANGNSTNGIFVSNNVSSSLAGLSITASTMNNNASGLNISGVGALSNLTIDDLTADSNTTHGISMTPGTGGSIDNASISNARMRHNTNAINLAGGGSLTNMTFDTIDATQNQNGLLVPAASGSTRSNIAFTNLDASNNTATGISLNAGLGNTISNFTFSQSHADGNASGINLTSSSTGSMTGVSFTDVTVNNNTGVGINLRAANTSALTGSFQHTTATGNGSNGVYFDDDTTGSYSIDFGGGGISSGNNRVFGNTGKDLRVDLDGLQLKAENNWWGSASGLQAVQQTLEVGSTVDASPFLSADPGP